MILFRFTSVLLSCLLVTGCTTRKVSRELIEVEKVKKIHSTYIKVHLQDGFLYVLNSWKINEPGKAITGKGNYYDFNRKLISSGDATIPFEKITVLETNDKGINPGIATMVILGLATVPINIYCLINPKACFGSCPTFYVQNTEGEAKLVAEGFSSSICKVLEERDVDIIDLPFQAERPAQVIVKNEALETHLIQNVNLLVVDKQPGERIFQSIQGIFYTVSSMKGPIQAKYQTNSIKDEISVKDHAEWFSLSDSANLQKKEDIFLEFENPGGETGLVVDKRQTLLTTFLFYHSLSLAGDATGYYLAEIENGNQLLKKRLQRFYTLMGGIEVAIQASKNKWKTIETIREAGPIVSDVHLVKLPKVNSKMVKVRLRMTKGLWRIDMINLATMIGEVIPQRLLPSAVYRDQQLDTTAFATLLNPNEYLVTYPGDVYTAQYPVNFEKDKEYFIESQGYYIEWMREEWLKHQDLKLAKSMLLAPARYLKRMAPAYKVVEPEMEKVFWNSRYTNKNEK